MTHHYRCHGTTTSFAAARADLLAFTAFPKQIRRQTALIRLVGAVFAEQDDEWIEYRRYLGLDVLSR